MIKTERLRQILDYDHLTGAFRCKIRLGKLKVGSLIGSKHSGGYREACIEGHRVFLHRLAWQYVHGVIPKNQIDHINGDRSDNRIDNLRLANQQQNSGNMRIRKSNKSGAKGVVIDSRNGAIRAYIHVNYKTKYLGTFDSKNEAHEAYLKAAQEHFSEFARAR